MRTAIKAYEDATQKQHLMGELAAHTTRAKAFHAIMKENPYRTISYIFDLQQVQSIPKLSTGEAFHACQVSFYCLCITEVANENTLLYLWNESQAGRGSQEVSSALVSFLQQANIDDSVTHIRLFADGCEGQNKYQYVVHALAPWLQKELPLTVQQIILYFPVHGHSYLPANRVFGRVEEKLRKIGEIMDPTHYHKIYAEVADIRVLGRDWVIKDLEQLILKPIDAIHDMKRIILKKTWQQNEKREQ